MDANESSDANLWMSMAGRDAGGIPGQLDRQTSELMTYVQQQNDEIDVRQAELNAKLAQLDNELRTARLRNAPENGGDLSPDASLDLLDYAQQTVQAELAPPATSDEPATAPPVEPVLDPPIRPEDNQLRPASAQPAPTDDEVLDSIAKARMAAAPIQEFDEVETIVAQIAGKDAVAAVPGMRHLTLAATERARRLAAKAAAQTVTNTNTHEASVVDKDAPAVDPSSIRKAVTAPNSMPSLSSSSSLGLAESGVDMNAMAQSLDQSALESERRLLAERKVELDQRQATLQKMQDSTQALHKEALEMRLVTEQMWGELSENAPEAQLQTSMAHLRSRLDDHYASMHDSIGDRNSELATLKAKIDAKQQELQAQSRKLEEWIETRHEEIKSLASEMDARELLLDRREHRLHEEFSKWESQRTAYQNQLQSLLSKLNLQLPT